MDSLEYFMESLTQEQDKLVVMGTIKYSKHQNLVTWYSKLKSKNKKKAKRSLDQKGDKAKSQEESLNSKTKNF